MFKCLITMALKRTSMTNAGSAEDGKASGLGSQFNS